MGLLCVLGFIFLNTLYHGCAQAPTAHLNLKYNWSDIFWGETVTFRCEIQGSGDTDWEYGWKTRGSDKPLTTQNEYRIGDVIESHNGEYMCLGRKGQIITPWSDPITLTVTPHRPGTELKADRKIIQAGGDVTLTCVVNPPSSGWKFHWYRGDRALEIKITPDAHYSVTQGGSYSCRGARGDPPYYTENSNEVTINTILSHRAVVTKDPEWPEIFSGEMITLRCVIQTRGVTKWNYEWESTGSVVVQHHSEAASISIVVYSGGKYKCKGKPQTDLYSSTEWSAPLTLTASEHTPKAELSADNKDIPGGGSVTLTCTVNPSSNGWKYTFWYKQDESAFFKVIEDSGVTSAGQIQVSEEGLYQCTGQRGNPPYTTESSNKISIDKKNANKAVLTLHPDWSEIYYGERMTFQCEIESVSENEWDYEWETTSVWKPEKKKKHSIASALTTHGGNYKCRGRRKSDRSSTVWSNTITLTVLLNEPESVLDVSSLWPSPGASVTLSCEVKDPSAGWRFFWYKTVPKLPGNSYSSELLSGSSSGTEQSSFMVHGHTAGYVCRAGRGDPVFYSRYSASKFVWSADFHPAASLRVSPNRVQHFISDSVSLNCEGNSSQWRVKRFLKENTVLGCSTPLRETESSCTIPTFSSSNDVFWCESESGEFSNAVNITKLSDEIILESPVHPVTEGSSVSLSCRLKSRDIVSNVFFYHNNKLIQKDTREELNISAVSKSDEGFYKCQSSETESAQSWMSVREGPESGESSLPMIFVGVVCGVVLLVLLLLLYRYRKTKDRCCSRSLKSKNKDQNSVANHGDAGLYESVEDHREPVNGTGAGQSQDVTYSLIEIKNMGKKGKQPELSESAIYSDVKISKPDDTIMYAEVSCHSTGKDQKKKGKSKAAPTTEDTVYSQVKPGTTSGQ